jgi:short subunit dehydrogenase-like uncharacterized protein
MEREYDIIVWGASGFTGRLVVDYMAAQAAASNLKWAVAGRNIAKVRGVLGDRDIPVVQADSHDDASIHALAQKARVILTTVGPYARYGSSLVAACAQHGTHYCDLTGEVHWMRDMITAHQETAKASGARIVHTCGFDSIPSDMGVYFLQKHMLATHGVPAKQIKYRPMAFSGGFSGGTIDSMMAMMESAKEDKGIFKRLADPYVLNDTMRGLDGPDRMSAYFDEDFDAWVGPFVMAGVNTRVVRRSAELLNGMYGSDFQYNEATPTGKGAKGFLGATGVGLGSAAFAGMASLGPTRSLLQRFLPKPGEGPYRRSHQQRLLRHRAVRPAPNGRQQECPRSRQGRQRPGLWLYFEDDRRKRLRTGPRRLAGRRWILDTGVSHGRCTVATSAAKRGRNL